ncbi:hypothetical protein Y032_0017g3429 [Ancylostoma ceylanicum]|uniref:Uncharacterized protein n=1 Tax=Ancylostoma ceylanicum TaxID=53326 RepID=A0A016V5P9_9BILA|nr:hypothetical protein Y032_0017g3429 [Ancylostoma ceylanicum]
MMRKQRTVVLSKHLYWAHCYGIWVFSWLYSRPKKFLPHAAPPVCRSARHVNYALSYVMRRGSAYGRSSARQGFLR